RALSLRRRHLHHHRRARGAEGVVSVRLQESAAAGCEERRQRPVRRSPVQVVTGRRAIRREAMKANNPSTSPEITPTIGPVTIIITRGAIGILAIMAASLAWWATYWSNNATC